MLDERLVKVLTDEDIRLLRVEWLLARREDYKIQRRQQLEKLEPDDRGLSPFLTGEEAADLIRNGAREVGALSYGWLLPWDPDPTRERLRLLQRVLKQKTYIKAIFWDQATLYQPPRTAKEDEAFYRALNVMMDLYASAIGTTCALPPVTTPVCPHASVAPPYLWQCDADQGHPTPTARV